MRTRSNPLRRAFLNHVKSIESAVQEVREGDGADLNAWDWIEAFRWIKGRPWDWESVGPKFHAGKHDSIPTRLSRVYLKQYINDDCDLRSLSKCRQSELTEGCVNILLHLCCTRPGTNVQHVFPTDGKATSVSRQKILPAIKRSPRINSRTDHTSVHEIEFINGNFYSVVGSLSKTAGRTISQDLIAYDEYDFLAPVEAVMDEMMSHSDLQKKLRFSTPTAPNVGIDRAVQDGCEFVWLWRCEKCGQEQQWTWPDNLINYFEPSSSGFDRRGTEYQAKLDEAYFGCSKCGAWADRNSDHYESHALWRPTRESMVGIHNSYRVVGGMIPWKSGKEILGKAHELADYPGQFRNEVWGTAHLGQENRLQANELLRCTRSWKMLLNRTPQIRHVSIGIDVEKQEVWITVRTRGVDRDVELPCIAAFWRITRRTLEEWGIDKHASAWAEATCRVCERYSPERIVIDANGIGARDFEYLLNRFPQKDRVWGAFFDTAESQRTLHQSKMLVPQWNEKKKQVTFSHVNELRNIFSEVRRGRVGIPALTADSAEILKIASRHHAGTAIQPRWDSESEREYEIAVRVQQDNHLLCANMYARVGEIGLAGHGTQTGVQAYIGGRMIGTG